MVREDTQEVYELIQEIETRKATDWVEKETVYNRLENKGWGEYRIYDAEEQLFNEGMVEESIGGELIRTTYIEPN
jgi:hypothetical protein